MIVQCSVIIILVGYLLGSCNGALIVSKLMLGDDVRSKGSGNAGLTNFLRSYGGVKTFLVIGIDIFKVVIAALLAVWLLGPLGYELEGKMLAGCAAMLGHVYPIYFGFKGGKGILTTGAFALVLSFKLFAIVMSAFIILVLLTKRVSIGSIVAAALFPVGCFICFGFNTVVTPLSIFIAALLIIMHKANIKRLIDGTEPKLSIGSKEKKNNE